jgi:hypothetical protein
MADNGDSNGNKPDPAGKGLPLKLGKAPARPGAVKLRFTDFLEKKVDKFTFPKVPTKFGHENLFPAKAWGMLGNDQYGDCVWAGAAHEHMLWAKAAGRDVKFDSRSVLSDYSAVTGFDINHPDSTDNGTDMTQAASYRRKTGIVDTSGQRHQILAYLALDPGNIKEHLLACYMFGAVGIGIEFPASAMDQFNKGKNWVVVRGSPIEGGHYIPLFAKRSTNIIVTWAQTQGMTNSFFKKYNDESIAYVTDEFLKDGKSPEGFDIAGLQSALQNLPQAA